MHWLNYDFWLVNILADIRLYIYICDIFISTVKALYDIEILQTNRNGQIQRQKLGVEKEKEKKYSFGLRYRSAVLKINLATHLTGLFHSIGLSDGSKQGA